MSGQRGIIVLLGPPGVGKGTQGQRWAEENEWLYAATGDLLREAVQKQTPIGIQAKAYMEKGLLVPDELMDKIVEEVLLNSKQSILLDGYPRTLAQAQVLDEMAQRLGWKIQIAVLMTLSDDEIVDRLSARRICPNCKAIYNLKSKPPRNDEICDECSAKLIQRDDDRPEVIRKRLAVYHEQTAPVVNYYRSKGILTEVCSLGTPEEVYERLKKVTLA
ncbi:MAG: adenylate kinase [Armatimonadetes bacterium]|nr:adenylate kinase [Armatimonadota bacterium]MDW8027531.1 adenylate kinase [Armatimonadota bacterium]